VVWNRASVGDPAVGARRSLGGRDREVLRGDHAHLWKRSIWRGRTVRRRCWPAATITPWRGASPQVTPAERSATTQVATVSP